MTQDTEAQRSPRQRAVTISQIAAAAGVSVPTVSKVINGRVDVAAETRRRVEDAIQKFGYERSYRTSARHVLLELVFTHLDSEWGVEILRGVEQEASRRDIALVVSEMHGRRTPGRAWIQSVLMRRPIAVIAVLSGFREDALVQLRSRGIPLVVIDPAGDPPANVPSVGVTNWSGGVSAARHLLALGHTRLAVIGGPERVMCSRARIDGFRAALDTAAVDFDTRFVRHGDFRVEGGIREARALLSMPQRPTAIFAGNDHQALGVYQVADEMGLRVPDDLSVVGFDDLPLARWVGPPLTTIRQPLIEMAATAARLAIGLNAGEEVDAPRIELATELIVRKSTAAPPSL
jgi:DNA-binding LacI/PurR family transcriptional regulator